MIPLQPVSVKFTDEERTKLKALASALEWTESQVVRDSVAAIVFLVQHPESETIPKIIGMARQALQHEEKPLLLQPHIKQTDSMGVLSKIDVPRVNQESCTSP